MNPYDTDYLQFYLTSRILLIFCRPITYDQVCEAQALKNQHATSPAPADAKL